jgi:YHS domain-containing protein
MNRWKIPSTLALLFLWATPLNVFAQHKHGHDAKHGKHEEKGSKLPLCPVMGDPVDFSVKTMTDDGPVYFCCENCIEKFNKKPQKYAPKVAAQRTALKKLERVQVNCRVSGNPIDGKTFAMVDGQGVYFCCKNCVAKYEKDPAKLKAKLEASYTYQTRCPVMGAEIDPAAFVDLPTGQRVYFCSQGCDDKLLKDPEKYAAKLAAQGINVDVSKLKGGQGQHAGEGHGSHGHGGHEGDHP